MKKCVVYYSYEGNTKKIVDMILKEVEADCVALEPVTPYAGDYDSVVNQAEKEVKEGYHPAIKPIPVNLDDYDTIILGTPVWWYTMAPVVLTFLKEYNLEGKTVVPFATNAGWLGHTFGDIKKMCGKAKVENEMNILFSGSQLKTERDKIREWIKRL